MTVFVKILAVLVMPVLAGTLSHARVWTNDRGATVKGVLVAVRETEVDLRLPDGRIVAVPRQIFCGEDQTYIQDWVQSGGTLADADADNLTPEEQAAIEKYLRSQPNWEAAWPKRAGVNGFLLVKTVQESDEWCVYETDHFMIECAQKLSEEERQMLAYKFEAALQALAALPLNLTLARKPSRKYLVRVCLNAAEMEAVHGLRKGRVKFSPTSFTVLLERDKNGKPVKPDEIDPRFALAHWVMQSLDMEHWMVDAFSDYMEFLPTEKHEVLFTRLPERLKKMLPRNILTGKTAIPRLEVMLRREAKHTADGHGKLKGIQDKDAVSWGGLLWMVYWFHLEGDGQAQRIRKYLRAWNEDGNKQARAILMAGKSAAEVQADMAAAWKKLGVKIKFDELKPTPDE